MGTARLRRHAFDAFLKQDMGFFDSESNSAAELTGFLAEKITLIESLTGGTVQAMLRVMAAVITMIVLVFVFGPWRLSLFLFGAMPAMIIIMTAVLMTLVGDEIKEGKG